MSKVPIPACVPKIILSVFFQMSFAGSFFVDFSASVFPSLIYASSSALTPLWTSGVSLT